MLRRVVVHALGVDDPLPLSEDDIAFQIELQGEVFGRVSLPVLDQTSQRWPPDDNAIGFENHLPDLADGGALDTFDDGADALSDDVDLLLRGRTGTRFELDGDIRARKNLDAPTSRDQRGASLDRSHLFFLLQEADVTIRRRLFATRPFRSCIDVGQGRGNGLRPSDDEFESDLSEEPAEVGLVAHIDATTGRRTVAHVFFEVREHFRGERPGGLAIDPQDGPLPQEFGGPLPQPTIALENDHLVSAFFPLSRPVGMDLDRRLPVAAGKLPVGGRGLSDQRGRVEADGERCGERHPSENEYPAVSIQGQLKASMPRKNLPNGTRGAIRLPTRGGDYRNALLDHQGKLGKLGKVPHAKVPRGVSRKAAWVSLAEPQRAQRGFLVEGRWKAG